MELTLVPETATRIRVFCNARYSHTFDLDPLLLKSEEDNEELLEHPEVYGKRLYQALFPSESRAWRSLPARPTRILLVPESETLDAIPWEYVYGPYGIDADERFLVLQCPVVRGLPANKRIAPPRLETGLHIIAIPSSPLSDSIEQLDIESDWIGLKEAIEEVPYAMTVERARPPTLERVRQLVAGQQGLVLHFIGHGEQNEQGALLCFEQESAGLDWVAAWKFVQRLQGTVFLVTLNACVSAKPGPTTFSNLAAALVRRGMPYALGMRFGVSDRAARAFAHSFYSELAHGSSVEQALFQARHTLDKAQHPRWVIGVPVLYTSLAEPAASFVYQEGIPTVEEYPPRIDINALPPVEGTFQGRIGELIELGIALTGDQRQHLETIHGGGGQGKTALALKAAERFAWAWPGGVWATTLENPPDRATFATDLARFLDINMQQITDLGEVERLVLQRLQGQRTLLILDNAETLIEAVERREVKALELVAFIKRLLGTSAHLLVTSRELLGWAGEHVCELGGLAPGEGAALFRQHAGTRAADIDPVLARELSNKLDGHALGLCLLGGAFGESDISLSDFINTIEEQLAKASDKYVGDEHRHYKLYACIEVSVRSLESPLRTLLSGLWIFHAPFLTDMAVAIFDPDVRETEQSRSPVRDQLRRLWQRGLLTQKTPVVREGRVQFYALLPTTRPYVEQQMEQQYDRELLQASFGREYLGLVEHIYSDLGRSAAAVVIAQQSREDLERGREYVRGIDQGYYARWWGWILYRLGLDDPFKRRRLLEEALEMAQEADQQLFLLTLNNLADVYRSMGQPQEALKLFEQSLSILREVEDRDGEAVTLSNMAGVYFAMGQPQQALKLYEQALPTIREVGDRAGEAMLLNSIAEVNRFMGQPQQALKLYEQALPIMKEVGDRAGEAKVLSNIAAVYQDTGQLQEALKLYEQGLLITREVGDRAEESTTLSNMASLYDDIGEPQEALKLLKQGLLITREIGNRAGEAAIVSNVAAWYQGTGQPQEALKLYEQALSIKREVEDRAGEAATLHNMASLYDDIGQPREALKLLKQALLIMREVEDRAGEAATLSNMASVYRAIGRTQEALKLLKQTLPIMREVGNQAGEAATLSDIAGVYDTIGQPQQALKLYEQALPIMKGVGDRAGEAAIQNNMAGVYRAIGQPQEALRLYEQALPIMKGVGDRAREATLLNNLAEVYRAIGQPQEALKLYEQALPIRREVGDRAGEATTLNNMAGVYRAIGQPQQALELLKQALPIRREVEDRAGEAATLNNMAAVYRFTNQPQEALRLYEQALPIMREVGDRTGEAATLSSVAGVYDDIGQPQAALKLYEQALPIRREVEDRAGEAKTLVGLFILLNENLNRPAEATAYLEEAIKVLRETGLPQDAGGWTVEELEALLAAKRGSGTSPAASDNPSMLPAEVIQRIVDGTIAVLTVASEQQNAWSEQIKSRLHDAQQQGAEWQIEVAFFTAVLTLIEGREPELPPGHPYAPALAAIRQGITQGEPAKLTEITFSVNIMHAIREFVNSEDWVAAQQIVEARQELLYQPEVEDIFASNIERARADGDEQTAQILEQHLAILLGCKQLGIAQTFELLRVQQQPQEEQLPFDAELLERSIEALRSGPQEKVAHIWYLVDLAGRTTDNQLEAFINVILLALAGGDRMRLGQHLQGEYQQAWKQIVEAVEKDEGEPH